MPTGAARRSRPERHSRRLRHRRRRGLALAALLALIVASVIVIFSSSDGSGDGAGGRGEQPRPSSHLGQRVLARSSARRLPAPISGEALAGASSGLLVIGGLDAAGSSTAEILALGSTGVRPFGQLAEPLHDSASARLAGKVLVFGGGSAATIDRVESVAADGSAHVIGRMPGSRSDLSTVTIDGSAYLLGGYDGQTTVAPVLRTRDGRHFSTIAELPTPVRYTAVATFGRTIYALGGELADGADTNQIQAIDLDGGRARIVGHLPEPVSHAAAVRLGTSIYLLGGRRNGSASDRILAFDPGRTRTTSAGRLPFAVSNAAAGSLRGSGYLVGGLDAAGAPLSSIVKLSRAGPVD